MVLTGIDADYTYFICRYLVENSTVCVLCKLATLFSDVNVENFDVTQLPDNTLRNIEADSYWCASKLLDGIQDNYTFAQPGIQLKVNALKELVKRINGMTKFETIIL